ncbi:hypothetical protein ATW7_00560 [Alteromonadales bacterium TW-7]|nr:hypothetical protein ATW7_00560 [Alteromonadales bacterium TW-7]
MAPNKKIKSLTSFVGTLTRWLALRESIASKPAPHM